MVIDRLYPGYQPDSEFIDSTGSNVSVDGGWVYVQPSVALGVVNYSSSFVGETGICFDGSVTGENCLGHVVKTDQCTNLVGDAFTCDRIESQMSDGSTCSQPGDSGGPIYVRNGGSTVVALGIDHGHYTSSDCLYTEITSVLSWLDVGLITVNGSLQPPQNLGDTLWSQNQVMNPNQLLLAQNGQYEAVMQGDGNFVIYSTTRATWSAGGGHSGDYMLFQQPDGNFVRYEQGGIFDGFSTGTQGNPGDWIVMQGDGHLVVYKQGGVAIWYRPNP